MGPGRARPGGHKNMLFDFPIHHLDDCNQGGKVWKGANRSNINL